MSDKVLFLDTSVLVYLFDFGEPAVSVQAPPPSGGRLGGGKQSGANDLPSPQPPPAGRGSERLQPAKKTIAEGIFGEYTEIRLSTQALQKFYVTVTRKLGRPMPPEQALTVVEQCQTYPVAVIINSVITKGIRRSIDSNLRRFRPRIRLIRRR